jgi:hypothetical protein
VMRGVPVGFGLQDGLMEYWILIFEVFENCLIFECSCPG